MRLHRFYTENNLRPEQEVTVSDQSLEHQIRKVFRLKVGDSVILFNGNGEEYVTSIKSFEKGTVTFFVDSYRKPKTESENKIILATAIPKKDKFEWVLEKGTEIGVSEFVPIISERTEKKNVDEERSKKIIKEAAEQSGRVVLPVLHPPIDLQEFLVQLSEKKEMGDVENKLIVCDGTGEKSVSDFKDETILYVLIGPEGGWSERELELFKEKNIPIVKLGRTVLRAETAAIVAASQLIL